MPRTNMATILVAAALSLFCYQRANQTRYASTVASAMSQIDMHFVDPIERRDLFEASMEGMVTLLDPYSSYINPEEYERLLEEIEQQFGGVGIVIDFQPETNRPIVLSVRPGGPAYDAGLKAGDVIMAIDGELSGDLGAEGPVQRIRGEPGTSVTLTILSEDEVERDVDIVRAVIPIESVMGYRRGADNVWIYTLPDDPQIGYVWLESFGEDTSRELAAALKNLDSEVEALVVDVRANAGGVLTAAVEVCDMFIPDGTIVTIRGRYSMRERVGKSGNEYFSANKPIAILADRYSASAAEIFAACMQDFGRGVVIGERSWGKGTVQSVLEMEGGRSALRLTTATYWRPSGENIHRSPDAEEDDTWGVQPDDGFELKYDRDEYALFLRSRSRRATGSLPESPERDGDEEQEAVVSEDGEPEPNAEFEDRQLKMAVDHLLAELGGS